MKALLQPVVGLALLAGTLEAQQVPTEAAAKELLARLDAAFNDGDAKAFLSQFAPLHLGLHARMEHLIRQCLQKPAVLQQKSRLIRFDPRGKHGIALFEQALSCGKPGAAVTMRKYMAFVQQSDGPKARFMLPVNGKYLDMTRDGPFRCPPCNYGIGLAKGWLTVPARTDRTGCMESLTFLSLEHDLFLEFSVQVQQPSLPARKALTDYLEKMEGSMPIRKRGAISNWRPPAYKERQPKLLSGAKCDLSLARVSGTPMRQARVHLATFGPMRYLLVLRQPSRSSKSAQDAAAKLLASFRLLDPDLDAEKLGQKAIDTYTGGGTFVGTTYTNPTHNLRFSGPEDWQTTVKAGGYLFLVRYACATQSNTVSVRAVSPMFGQARWNRASATKLLEDTCKQANLDIKRQTDWQPPGGKVCADFTWCDVVAQPADGLARHMRLAFRNDVLVIAEARVKDDAAIALVQTTMDSLARAK